MESRRRHPGTLQALKDWLRLAAKACFPHFCVGCGLEGRVLCDACQPRLYASLRGVLVCPGCGSPSADGRLCNGRFCSGGPLDFLVAVVPYADRPWRRLMHLWKYQGVAEAGLVIQDALGTFVTGMMAVPGEKPSDSAEGGEAPYGALSYLSDFTPVPIGAHPWRLWQRGFNQAVLLAATVGEATGQVPVRCLGKRFRWRSQVQSGGEAATRARNVAGAFHVVGSPPERVLLVDDTATTGSTLAAAARVLRAAGAMEVGAVAFMSARRKHS